jgi:hypothetical protein
VQDNLTISKNQNSDTNIRILNTTAGTISASSISVVSDALSGTATFGKFSSGTNAYKILTANTAYLFNGTTAGDIAIFNDFATGRIRFATGGSATTQMNLFSTGNFAINTTTDAGFRLDVNGTARVSGNTRIGNSTYNNSASNLTIGIDGAPARAVISNNNSYQDFIFVNTSISSGNINSWGFGQRQDTYFGNTLGSFQIVGAYADNSGISPVSGGFRVPMICNPNGDVIISGASNSINGNVSIGSTTITASALLSVTSTTKGFLPPRMTTTQRNAIASPAAGLIVYDTTLNLPHFFNGTIWVSL